MPGCTPEWGEEGTLTAAGEDQKLRDRGCSHEHFSGNSTRKLSISHERVVKLIEDLVTEYEYNMWWGLGEFATLGWYVCDIRGKW